MITDCQGLTMEEKSSLRRLLDQNVVTLDSMVVSGTLISIPELKLVISDNQGKYHADIQPLLCTS